MGENESDLEPVYKPNKSRFRSDRGKRTVDEISSMKYLMSLSMVNYMPWAGTVIVDGMASCLKKKSPVSV